MFFFIAIEFSAVFKRKANFPQVPELAGEIDRTLLEPNKDRLHEFVPGRDDLYEQAVREERVAEKTILDFEFDNEDGSEYSLEDSDNDSTTSLSFVDTDQIDNPSNPPIEDGDIPEQQQQQQQQQQQKRTSHVAKSFKCGIKSSNCYDKSERPRVCQL
jgi:hypothetical protein